MQARFFRAVTASAALVAALALAGCMPGDVTPSGRSQAPLSEKMLSEIASKNMDKESPILARIFKEEAEMEVWKQTRDGQYELLKTYPICRWSGDLGPKKKEGDRQAPEGFYTITPGQMNPASSYYLAFDTGFPNSYDRSHGYTGSNLMVHGDCSSRGCYAMTDEQIQEIYALARESFAGGQKSFQLQAMPFRMTAANMARHRNSPHFAFWKMLKEGYDNFEATRQQPKVAVCERRYVFDAEQNDANGKPLRFNASAQCPAITLDRNIADAVLEHRRNEQFQMASLIAKGGAVAQPRHGIDGGMNQVFADKIGTQDGYDNRGRAVQVATAPGMLPRENNQPAPATLVTVPKQVALSSDTSASGGATGLLGNLLGGSRPAAAPVQEQPAVAQPAPATRTAAAPPRIAAPARNAPISTPVPPARPALAAAPAPAPAPAPRVAQAAPQQQQAPEATVPVPPPQLRTAFSATPQAGTSGNTLQGSQAVVPVGSFAQRWSGSSP